MLVEAFDISSSSFRSISSSLSLVLSSSLFHSFRSYYLSLYMASKCIIDSKLTDDSELVRGYTYHCDRRSVICVSPIHLGDTMWIRISRQSQSICVSLGSLPNQIRFFELTLCYFVLQVTSHRLLSTKV